MALDDNNPSGGGTSNLETIQQSGVQNLGLIIQAIRETFPNWQTVPATASSAGVAGQVAYQSGWLYICVASNTWQRVAIGTF